MRQLNPSTRFSGIGNNNLQILWEDSERVFCRAEHDCGGDFAGVLAVLPAAGQAPATILDRFAHEFALKEDLDRAWAAHPLQLVRENGRTVLVLEDPGGEPLDRHLGRPMELGQFLRFAINLSAALRELHERGIIHKDIKPTNVLVNAATGQVWLTGFGIASRLPRERQSPSPPEVIAGTLAYMAPEQTGRMNRSIDARSDLYALGVTLYQMITGNLPFAASDPLEWVHCHIAKKPTPPSGRIQTIPATVSLIVLKLLAKTAEERYQTASGLEHDLRHCLAEWERHGRIGWFALGQQDVPDRLVIPEKLYGREQEVDVLLAAFDRVLKNATPELVLVSGYSGIGKSSVVNELHKVLVPPRGLFSSGKFDQYKRDIPYSTLAQAFQGLIRPLLGKSEAELSRWREKIEEALEANGQLMIDLVPELKLIVGDQPPVPELGAQDAQRRFQRALRRFLGVFAQPEHPLALFLDDLQWLDAATLDLIEDLLAQSELKHLMLIGAYRDNEVDASHPLMRKLEAIRQSGARVQEIWLAPLGHEHLRELTTDALRCAPERAGPLANLVHKKTAGNPFFVIQFLHALADEGLLTFDVVSARWLWDLDRLHAKGYTDNVVDLMVRKLVRRPEKTQQALQQLACLGAVADTTTLAIALNSLPEQVHMTLWDALCQELVERREGTYRFIHDRVQEAAYSMIPEASRAGGHLRIGRLLAKRLTSEQAEEAIFDIVNQFNRGAALITSREEREQVARLNLTAGRRAKASTAYASARSYLSTGMSVLGQKGWTTSRELAFGLWLERAECEYLNGNFDQAEQLISELLMREMSKIDKAAVYRLKVDVHVVKSENPEAVESALECLRLFGFEMPPHPTREQVDAAYEKVWKEIGERPIGSLIDLPLMTDPEMQAAMRVLSVLFAPAYFTDFNLVCLHLCHMVNTTLRYGTTDASTHAYAWFGVTLGSVFRRYSDAYSFCRLACDLVERNGVIAYKAKTYFPTEMVALFTQPLEVAIEAIRTAFHAAVETGDLTIACYSCNHTVTDRLTRGDHLDEAWQESERGLDFASKAKFRDVIDIIVSQQRFIENMRGRTANFSTFNDAVFDENAFETELTADRMATMVCWYWIIKVQARFMSGDYEAALVAARKAKALLWSSDAHIQLLDYQYYTALALAAAYESVPLDRRSEVRGELMAHLHQLQEWAESCSATFQDKHVLVAAEIARLDGRTLDAEQLYEEAIRLARENRFVQNEGIANELASHFYAARGLEKIARVYLRDARHCYQRWGARGKVRQLDEAYPYLRDDEPAAGLTSTIRASIEHLDLATVVKVSQAISGEMMPQRLIDTLMRTAVEQAGAERGVLILYRSGQPRIAAEATIGGDKVIVRLCDEIAAEALPESVLQQVVRTHDSIIIEDAAIQSSFAADPYILKRQSRSILCLPLLNQAKLIGVLFLENQLAAGVFAPGQIAVLKLVASQAAIALENSRLYGDLQAREAKIRRLVDANIIGILIFDLEGRILDANDAFLRMVGYDREDLASGRLSWTDLTPPKWRDRDAQRVEQVKTTGTVQAFEKEYFRKDGSRVPVLVGAASFEESNNQGVAFVLDLSERKQAEAEAREIERRYREVQMELAHANRVATVGQLTASIAHEVNQPLAATIGNAEAALRWLVRDPPDLEEVRQVLSRIVKDGHRANNVVSGIRDLVKKAPPRMERLEINSAIGEVIELTRSETTKNSIVVKTQLMEGLPFVKGDRTQLQQVMLNLIMNAVHALSDNGGDPRDLLIATSMAGANTVLVSVRDSGPGISSEQVERLFDPFYTTKSGGMGMGLSICRSILETHGGRIWAATNEPRGAAFNFVIPIAQVHSFEREGREVV